MQYSISKVEKNVPYYEGVKNVKGKNKYELGLEKLKQPGDSGVLPLEANKTNIARVRSAMYTEKKNKGLIKESFTVGPDPKSDNKYIRIWRK